MSESAIQIENLSFKYRKTVAVDGLNLEVPKGCIFGFLGENGAGKTTTIRILMGLLKPRSGRVSILGMNPVGGNPKLLQKIGYVSDDRAMYRSFKIREILKFNAGLYEHWDENFVKSFMEEFELDPKKRIGSLSMGHLALVALMCAAAPCPEVLILDEPCNGLDPIMRKKYLARLLDLRDRFGTTIFFSSHLVGDIEQSANEVAILCKGKLFLQKGKESLRASLKRLILEVPETNEKSIEIPSSWKWILSYRRVGSQLHFVVQDLDDQKQESLQEKFQASGQIVEMSLEEVFSEYTLWAKSHPDLWNNE